jgi:cephalosporin hydroxylase
MNPAGEAYLRWYYDSAVWKHLSYRGVRTLKLPLDMWNYQEIIAERRIEWVLETGTRHGGSALFFADLLAARAASGYVISVDVEHASLQISAHPKLRLLLGDSASPFVVAQVAQMLPKPPRPPLFVILDSDHRKAHVLRELEAYVPMMQRGDYLVVEDSCVNGHPVRPEFGPGPMEAIGEFIRRNSDLLAADSTRETKFGCTFAPRGYFTKK